MHQLNRALDYAFVPDISRTRVDRAMLELALRALRIPRTTGIAIAIEEGGEFVCRASVGETVPTLGVRFNGTEGITGECIRTHATIVCEDVRFDSRVNLAASEALGIASLAAVPIMNDERCAGVLEAFAIERDAFGRRSVVKLEKLATEAAAQLAAAASSHPRNDGGIAGVVTFRNSADRDSESSAIADLFVDFSEPSVWKRIRQHGEMILSVTIGILVTAAIVMIFYWHYTGA